MVLIVTWATYRVAHIVKYLKLFIIQLHLTITTEACQAYCVQVVTTKHKHYASNWRNNKIHLYTFYIINVIPCVKAFHTTDFLIIFLHMLKNGSTFITTFTLVPDLSRHHLSHNTLTYAKSYKMLTFLLDGQFSFVQTPSILYSTSNILAGSCCRINLFFYKVMITLLAITTLI